MKKVLIKLTITLKTRARVAKQWWRQQKMLKMQLKTAWDTTENSKHNLSLHKGFKLAGMLNTPFSPGNKILLLRYAHGNTWKKEISIVSSGKSMGIRLLWDSAAFGILSMKAIYRSKINFFHTLKYFKLCYASKISRYRHANKEKERKTTKKSLRQ